MPKRKREGNVDSSYLGDLFNDPKVHLEALLQASVHGSSPRYAYTNNSKKKLEKNIHANSKDVWLYQTKEV